MGEIRRYRTERTNGRTTSSPPGRVRSVFNRANGWIRFMTTSYCGTSKNRNDLFDTVGGDCLIAPLVIICRSPILCL